MALGLSASSDNPLFLTYTNPLILEFLAGALTGKLWLDGKVPSPAVGIALIVIATAGFTVVGITYLGFNAFVHSTDFAQLVNFRHPQTGAVLTVCEMFEQGFINEAWVAAGDAAAR